VSASRTVLGHIHLPLLLLLLVVVVVVVPCGTEELVDA